MFWAMYGVRSVSMANRSPSRIVTCSNASVPSFRHAPSSIRHTDASLRSRSRAFWTRCIGMMRSSRVCHTSTFAGLSFGAGFAAFASAPAAGPVSCASFCGFFIHSRIPKESACPSLAHWSRLKGTTRMSAGKVVSAA